MARSRGVRVTFIATARRDNAGLARIHSSRQPLILLPAPASVAPGHQRNVRKHRTPTHDTKHHLHARFASEVSNDMKRQDAIEGKRVQRV